MLDLLADLHVYRSIYMYMHIQSHTETDTNTYAPLHEYVSEERRYRQQTGGVRERRRERERVTVTAYGNVPVLTNIFISCRCCLCAICLRTPYIRLPESLSTCVVACIPPILSNTPPIQNYHLIRELKRHV